VREVPTDGTVSGLRRALDELDEQGAEGMVTLRRPTLDDVFLSLTGDGPGSSDRRRDVILEESA
jgi:ABC-2 type transport system ATP-binding protein